MEKNFIITMGALGIVFVGFMLVVATVGIFGLEMNLDMFGLITLLILGLIALGSISVSLVSMLLER